MKAVLDRLGSADRLTDDILRSVTMQAIVVLDGAGVVVSGNDTAAKLHGRPPMSSPADLYGPPLDDGGPRLRQLCASGRWQGRVDCRHVSGRTVPAEMTVTLRRPEDDGFVLVYQPVAGRPGAALPSAPLLSLLGHELRSPLTGVIGLARMMHRKASGDPSQARQLTLLLASAVQMLRTTEQVADIARLQAGTARPAPAPIDCRDVAGEAVRTHRAAGAERGLRLLAEGPAEPVRLTCEGSLLHRLVHELVDNAVKYTSGAEVRVRVTDRPGAVTVEVADDGPAIAADERARIFGPFERGEAGRARDDGSAGLGLYLAGQLAQDLGAELRLGDGPGTVFAVEIPRREVPVG